MSVIYTQGGATTIADATTTVSGKVRLATIAEAGGSSEAIAVTPAGLQAEISGLASGIVYRGTINVADFGATLANASLGDYYKIATGGTAGDGRVYATGDAIIVNADMGGVFADAKLDKVDNVDPSTSDEITGVHSATAYTGANTDSVTTHLGGIDSALALRAPLASPALTGTPTAPTASAGTNTTQLATTAFVNGEISAISLASTDLSDSADLARLASPALTGTPTAPTATAGTNTTQLATTAFVTSAVAGAGGASELNDLSDVTISNAGSGEVLRHNGANFVNADLASTDLSDSADLARLASPALTGTPTAPTATAGTNTTQIATTAFVTSAVSGAGGVSELNDLSDVTISTAGAGEVLRHNGANFVNADLASTDLSDTADLARLASPALTGTPTAPTASAGTNTTQLATTAFVSGEISAISLASTDLSDSADLARLASPALTGTPTAPTATAGTNTTQLATTAFVTSAVAGAGASELNDLSDVTISNAGSGEVLRHNGANFVNADLASTDLSDTADLARLASPALTGTPTAPTATAGTNTTQIATTAFVTSAVSSGSGSAHDPSLVLVSSASYDMASLLSGGGLTATQIKGLNVWYSGTGATFTVTLPDIATVGAGITSIGGNPADTFEIYVGRGSAGDIVLSSTEGIDATGDGSVSFTPTSFTLNGRQFLKIIAWRSTSNNAQYIVESADLSEISEDTSPQLGGDLDTNQQQIITLSNRNIELAPNGTGVVELRGNQTGGNNTGALLFQCEQNSHGVTLKAPLHSATASLALTLPASDGGAGDALVTDGSGNLSFTTISGSGGGFTYATAISATSAQINYHYSCGAGNQSFAVTLPSASGASGQVSVKNMGTGTITIARTGGDTIDGVASDHVINTQYTAITLICNGSNGWEIR